MPVRKSCWLISGAYSLSDERVDVVPSPGSWGQSPAPQWMRHPVVIQEVALEI